MTTTTALSPRPTTSIPGRTAAWRSAAKVATLGTRVPAAMANMRGRRANFVDCMGFMVVIAHCGGAYPAFVHRGDFRPREQHLYLCQEIRYCHQDGSPSKALVTRCVDLDGYGGWPLQGWLRSLNKQSLDDCLARSGTSRIVIPQRIHDRQYRSAADVAGLRRSRRFYGRKGKNSFWLAGRPARFLNFCADGTAKNAFRCSNWKAITTMASKRAGLPTP